MTRQTVIRIVEESATDPNVSASVVEQSGSGTAWTLTSGRYRVGLSNSNPNSKTLTFRFSQDFRKASPTYNIPSSRCIVRYKARPGLYLSTFQGLGTTFNITYTSNYGNQNYSYWTGPSYSLLDIYQTGSDVSTRTANQQPINTIDSYFGLQFNTGNNNSNGLHDITIDAFPAQLLANTGPAGSLLYQWEADNIIIDGLDGDSLNIDTVESTLYALGGFKFYGSATLSTTATLNVEAAVTKFALPDAVNVLATTDFDSVVIFNSAKELRTQANLIATPFNFTLMDEETFVGSSSMTIQPTFKPTAIVNATTAFTSTQSAGIIYDINADYSWNTFNLNIYFESGFVEDNFVSEQGEYNWNFLETTAWDDWPTVTWIGNEAIWDNWPNDVWEESFTLRWLGTVETRPSFKLGDVVEYTGAFSFDVNPGLNEPAEADITASFTTDITAAGVIDIELEISDSFAPSLTANIQYSLNDTPIEITGAFTPVLTANAITDTFADIDVAFSFAVEPTFKPSAYQETYTAQSTVEINPTFKPAGFADLLALTSTLTVSRLFYQTDPYNIHTVLQETRTVMVPVENRQTDVLGENRVNTIATETRGYRVPQETRSLKLRIPPFKNRFTTPRIRQET